MTTQIRLLPILLAFLFTGWLTEHPGNGEKIHNYDGTELPKAELDGYLESQMEEMNIPGLSFVLINDGRSSQDAGICRS